MLDSDESVTSIESVESSLDLKEWLNSSKSIHFRFNPEIYEESLEVNVFDEKYNDFCSKNYKLLQQLSEIEQEDIGVIYENRDDQIDGLFQNLIENVEGFVKELEDIEELDFERIESYAKILTILHCLNGKNFSTSKAGEINKWINKSDPQPTNELIEDIMIIETPYKHPFFWNKLINKLIIRGLVNQTIKIMENCGFQDLEGTNIFKIIEDFIEILKNYNKMSIQNFYQWKLIVCKFRDSIPLFKDDIEVEHLKILNEISNLLYILSGSNKSIINSCDNWYEIIGALSSYKSDTIDSELIDEFYQIAIDERPPAIDEDKTFIDIWENNYLKVLNRVDELDSGLSSILSKFFDLKGFLKPYYDLQTLQDLGDLKDFEERRISHFLLIKFSLSCLNNHHLAPIGVGIITNSNLINNFKFEPILAEFLVNYNCQTNDDLEWCLTVCIKFKLLDIANELFKKYSSKSLNDGYIFESLNMLVKTGNVKDNAKEINMIVWDLIFQTSLVNNKPISDELINNIVTYKFKYDLNPIIKQFLSPYGVLFETFELLNHPETNYRKILLNLFNLLKFMHLPKKFLPLLLSQIIPIMEYLNKNDLIDLIEIIDGFEGSLDSLYSESNEIYTFSINNIDKPEPYDWRQYMETNSIPIPKDVKQLLGFLRLEISKKISKVYIS
ncbi:nucleoporin Nup85p [[Candida] jaroonii]|uniref:Nucleoporin Nup85p n=1 Tax=[Candida] jaroonii TaxID=467808 RepID=A0ACA9Y729_9ASCO|nr:nucleoporin Nup85p [[Candida] jaroonii]